MDNPIVSVVSPAYNRLEYTIKCIDSFKRHNKDFSFEHIIIDNGSFDGTREWFDYIRKMKSDWWDHIVYIHNEENLGDHPAKQQGIKAARGKYICTADSDAYITEPDWFKKMVEIYEILREDDPVGVIAPHRWLCKNIIIIPEPYEIETSFGPITCGKVNYGPQIFYDREVMTTMPYLGNYTMFPPGLELWKIWDIYLYDADYGTGSLSRDDDDPLKEKYGYGDQGHKYRGYFEGLVPTPGCKRDEKL